MQFDTSIYEVYDFNWFGIMIRQIGYIIHMLHIYDLCEHLLHDKKTMVYYKAMLYKKGLIGNV